MDVYEVSLSTLRSYVQHSDTYYVGQTRRDPVVRAREHYHDGKKGTMYYAESSNMRRDENMLINSCRQCINKMRSGAPRQPGYVYVLKWEFNSSNAYATNDTCCVVL